jgi:hypothetical protein
VHNYAEIVSERGPSFGRIDEIHGHTDPLLLDAERGYLQESGWVNARNATLDRRAAPTIDPHRRTGLDLHRIGGEEVRDDF